MLLLVNANVNVPCCKREHHYDNDESGKNDAPDDHSIAAFHDAIPIIYIAKISCLSFVAVFVYHSVVVVCHFAALIYSSG